jgi:hypothetical protein
MIVVCYEFLDVGELLVQVITALLLLLVLGVLAQVCVFSDDFVLDVLQQQTTEYHCMVSTNFLNQFRVGVPRIDTCLDLTPPHFGIIW